MGVPTTQGPVVRAERPAGLQSQAAVTKERLVVAFALAFAERGYLAVNLNEVLGGLGLTKGAFYFHFRSKNDVAREIVQRQYDLWESTQQAALASQAATLDTLVDTVRSVCRMYQTDPIAGGGGRLSSERSIIQAELPRPFVGWIDAFSELLANGEARGDLAAGIDPRQHANLLVAFLYGALMVSGELSRGQDLMARIDALREVLLPALTPLASEPRPAAPAASS